MSYIVVLILSKILSNSVILILPNIYVTTCIDVLNREWSMECKEMVYFCICLFSYCYLTVYQHGDVNKLNWISHAIYAPLVLKMHHTKFEKNWNSGRVSNHFWSQKYRNIGIFLQFIGKYKDFYIIFIGIYRVFIIGRYRDFYIISIGIYRVFIKGCIWRI
jgi:hypothetical protein